jgi:hypothetical protein
MLKETNKPQDLPFPPSQVKKKKKKKKIVISAGPPCYMIVHNSARAFVPRPQEKKEKIKYPTV